MKNEKIKIKPSQLKILRKYAFLDKEEVAEKTGWSMEFINKIETEECELTLKQIEKLSEIYNRDFHWFIVDINPCPIGYISVEVFDNLINNILRAMCKCVDEKILIKKINEID